DGCVNRGDPGFEPRGLVQPRPVPVDETGVTVENEAVLAADGVGATDHGSCFGCPPLQQRGQAVGVAAFERDGGRSENEVDSGARERGTRIVARTEIRSGEHADIDTVQPQDLQRLFRTCPAVLAERTGRVVVELFRDNRTVVQRYDSVAWSGLVAVETAEDDE